MSIASPSRWSRDWREGSAYEKAFLGPAPADPIYHAPKEVTLDLFKAFATGIELVRDQKLGKPLGAKSAEAKPQLAAVLAERPELRQRRRQSRRRAATLRAKAASPRWWRENRRASRTRSCSTSITPSTVLRGIDQPVATAVIDEDTRGKLEALRVALKGAGQTAGDMISQGRRSRLRVQRHGWRLSHAPRPPYVSAQPCLQCGHAGPAARAPRAAPRPSCFAAARRDDRGNFSAALFTLERRCANGRAAGARP